MEKIKVIEIFSWEKDSEYEPNIPKEYYMHRSFEEVEIDIEPERTQYLPNNIQSKRKLYVLKHRFTRTIHACQGYTLLSVATDISQNNENFKMWDKVQMILISSRTKLSRDTIFVGDKNDTIAALTILLTRKIQWTHYMEEVISIFTINLPTTYDLNTIDSTRSRIMNKSTYTFCIRDEMVQSNMSPPISFYGT